jgi:hypothetical protein
MRPQPVYIFYPRERYLPNVKSWLKEAEDQFLADPSIVKNWRVVLLEHNAGNAFNIQPVVVRIQNALGPALIVPPVHGRSVQLLREQLHGLCPVLVLEHISDSTDIWDGLLRATNLFAVGEPMLPRKFVVALLLMRKLDNEGAWAGKEKGYEYFDNLANGRGVDIKHRGIMPVIVNYLKTAGILIKKPSRSRQKYALNPNCKAEIYKIMASRCFPPELQGLLMEDTDLESARLLDLPEKPRVVLVLPAAHRGLLRVQAASPDGTYLSRATGVITLRFPKTGVLTIVGENPTLSPHHLSAHFEDQQGEPLVIATNGIPLSPDLPAIWSLGPCATGETWTSVSEFFVGTPKEASAAGIVT